MYDQPPYDTTNPYEEIGDSTAAWDGDDTDGGIDVGAALQRLQTAYDIYLEEFRPGHWDSVRPDRYHLQRHLFRLQHTPQVDLDHEALQVIEHFTAHYHGDTAPLLPAEQIAAHALALVAEFDDRGYRGPGRDYIEGAADAYFLLARAVRTDSDQVPRKLTVLSDDGLRGFCHQVLCSYDGWLRTRDLWALIPDLAGTGKPLNPVAPFLAAVDAELQRRKVASLPSSFARPRESQEGDGPGGGTTSADDSDEVPRTSTRSCSPCPENIMTQRLSASDNAQGNDLPSFDEESIELNPGITSTASDLPPSSSPLAEG